MNKKHEIFNFHTQRDGIGAFIMIMAQSLQ